MLYSIGKLAAVDSFLGIDSKDKVSISI